MYIIYFFIENNRCNRCNRCNTIRENIPKKIWLYWDDIEYPDIIKMCYNLININCKGYEINYLNRQNYRDYVDNDRVIMLMESDDIMVNFKSDLIRLYLVYKYGGIYLDSSIFVLESLDWVYNYNKYDLIMYKNNHHTTDINRPVLESWFICSKPNQVFIGNVLNKFIDVLEKRDLDSELKKLKMDRSVNYQNFSNHGTYHILYYIFIYVLYKYPPTNSIFLDCNKDKLVCSFMGNNDKIVSLFNKSISDNEYNNIQKEKLIKLTKQDRESIKKVKIVENSFIDRMIKTERDKFYFVDKILYINLNDRQDRKIQIENELKDKTLMSKIQRVDAVRDNPGHIGCSKSHIKCLELAINNRWKNVLILEDDAMFKNFDAGYDTLTKLIEKDPNYDAILLGGVSVKFDNKSGKLYSAQTASSYIVNSHYYNTLLENFKEGLSKLMITKNIKSSSEREKYESKYCVDQYWKNIQGRDNWYIVNPALMIQRPSKSSILNQEVDYTSFFNI